MSSSSFFKSSGTSVTIENTVDQLITDAETAKTAAETAATNASSSASLSSTYANNSSSSATNAANSLNSAQTAQSAAETAETNAETAQTAAETAETNAASSASTASTQASNASTSATNAASSASTASTKASEASTSATNAATSETNAATSATNAASSATTASGHSSTASTQASNASTSATNAATSETNAATSATTASTQASNASTSATNAASSASTASTQATNAANSATAAATSATNASNSATSAATSASTAQTLSNSFNNIYLGALSSAPSQDPDGSALDEGDLYYDTTQGELKVYKSSGWAAAGSTVNGTSARFHYDITTTTNTLSGADANGNTLAYDAGYVDVFVNGVRMSTADVTTTSGNSIVFADNLVASDDVDIVAYGTFVITQLNADNLDSGTVPSARVTGAYTGITTAGQLTFADNEKAIFGSSSGDLEIYSDGTYSRIMETGGLFLVVDTNGSQISLTADNSKNMGTFIKDGAVQLFYSNAQKFSTTSTGIDVTGTAVTDGLTVAGVSSFANGTNSAPSLTFTSDTNTGIYRGGTDILKFVTAGVDAITIDANSRVGIGTSTIPTADSVLTIRKDGAANEFNILSGTSSASVINMGDADDYNIQRIKADNTDNSLHFQTNNSEKMRIDNSGNVGIGVVPNTSWHSTLTALQLGGNGSLSAQSSAGASKQIYLSQNVFNDGDQKYISTDEASNYLQQNGTHIFQVASSGSANAVISWNTAMTLDSSGNVGIGTSPSNKLEVHSGAATNIVAKSTNGNGGYLNYSGLSSGGTTTFSVTHNGKIYAADGIQLGGTGSANHLDDYEEGTWTPQIYAGANITTSNVTAKYTKVGTLVHLGAQFKRGSSDGGTNTLVITGLPFTHTNHAETGGGAWFDNVGTDLRTFVYIDNGATQVHFAKTGASSSLVSINEWENGRWIYMNITYNAAS